MIDGGDLWPLVTVFGVLILGGVIAWAMMRNKTRDKRMDAVTEAATRDQYRNPDDGVRAAASQDGPTAASDGSPVDTPRH